MTSLFYIIGVLIFFAVLICPCLIVMFWQRHPVWAFFVALFVAFLFGVAPDLIRTFQAMMIYGTGDPQLMAGGISEAIVSGIFSTIIYIPFLFLFRWIGHRRQKKRALKALDKDTFS